MDKRVMKSISVSGETHKRMREFCLEKGISMAKLVEDSTLETLTAFEKHREAKERQREILFDSHPYDETRNLKDEDDV